MKTTALLFSLITAIASAQEVTVIKAGALIDGRSSDVKHNQTIVIRGNRIVSVGDNAAALTANSRVIDLSNMTVLPGLIDAHTHIFLQGEDPAEGGYDIQLLKYPLAYRAARATVSARRGSSRASRRFAMSRRKARATATSASS